METWAEDVLTLRLAEQALYKQSLEEKDERVKELDSEVRYLRNLLHSLTAVPRPALAASKTLPLPKAAPTPQRWKVG